MYESPIELFDVTNYTNRVNKEIDNYIYEYIVKLGINVNKEELIKALQYDRAQYEKGYKDGRGTICCANCNCKYNDYQGRCTCDNLKFSWGHIHTVNDGLKDIWECKSFEEQQNTKSAEFLQNNSEAILKAMQESADAVKNSPQYDFSCVTSLFGKEAKDEDSD